jgi:heptosyltransferase-1
VTVEDSARWFERRLRRRNPSRGRLGRGAEPPSEALNIGIVKLSSVGDVVHALPLVRALRRCHPGARLAWVVEAREGALLEGHPDLDAVVRIDTRRWRRLARRPGGVLEAWPEIARSLQELRGLRLDVAIDAQGLLKSGLVVAATGAPRRIGFVAAHCRERGAALFTTCRVLPPPTARHVVEQYLTLLGPLGIADASAEFCVPSVPESERRVSEWMTEHGLKVGAHLVAMSPGAGRPDKRWAAASFRRVAQALTAEDGAHVVALWGPGERGQAEEIATGLEHRVTVAPALDLRELAALLRRVALVIAGDTGPLHLGAALGTPCLGLYGPTSAERNGPYGPRCRALQSGDGTMAGLDPSQVLRAAREMLDGT